MKKHFIILAMLLLAACKNPNLIELDVNAPGLSDGTFIVKLDGKDVFGANVANGKCVVKGSLDAEGFYSFDVVKNGQMQHNPFEIFLEPGKYTITVDADKLRRYPQVQSDSKRQQEISDYNNIVNNETKILAMNADKLDAQLREKGDKMPPDQYNALTKKAADAHESERAGKIIGLEQFIKTHPKSEFAAHFMEQQEYQSDPARYYAMYQAMGSTAQNSAEGKMINDQLSHLIKLQPGSPAPQIAGKVFDGRTFAQITAGKKVFLIDFWKSGNPLSRTNHEKIAQIYDDNKAKGLQVISVSLDSKELWWTTAVKDDKLPWPQMADLKGTDSPNVIDWGVKEEPSYVLVSGDWKLLQTDVRSLDEAELGIKQYLAKHP